ncbi:unnamed protein product [Miscanthus lutarioriparius]|uniref:Glycosyltransferase n=1 Tax=Miscanthus lutarioriparius TaxID=422564 RepID=A0A811NKV7_9POAL|nr:unnamed protein product [Miscanthus lutarioriparius]
MAEQDSEHSIHVVLLPNPSQGHINPILQFGKRLAAHRGVRCTLAVTRFVLGQSGQQPSPGGAVHIAAISDGCDRGGFGEAGGIEAYTARLESAGSETVGELLRSEAAQGRPVRTLVYDAFLPWAQRVGRRHGAACAAFFTQPCAVDVAYGHAWAGRVEPPLALGEEEPLDLPGLPAGLRPADLPTFLTDPDDRGYLDLLVNQFGGLDTADHVLVNSFYELQPQVRTPLHFGSEYVCSLNPRVAKESDYMASTWRAKTASEGSKLPENFTEKTKERGLIVTWSPQLEVLAHPAVGCFVTLCGWNSTMEGLGAGVPMVAMPQWSDQTMNAKYIEDVWRVGVRVCPDDKGVVRKEELEMRVREVMEGERSLEYIRNAAGWKEKAKRAMSEGGSSDKNILEFLGKLGLKS